MDLKNINTDGQQFSVSLTDSTTALIQITGGNSITLKAGNNIILSQPHSTTLFIHSETAGFTNQNGVTSNARGDLKNDDFVFGSNQLDNDKSTTADNKRIFFDKSKGAFRAGFAQSDQWDEKKLGTYSIALGRNTIASGFHAAAFGSGTLSGAWYTTAMGQGTQALSRSETAIGQFNTTYSPAGSTDNWVPIDRLFVIGNGTVSGTVVSRSDALVMLKNGNTEVSGTWTGPGFIKTSDARLKTDLYPIQNALELLNQLQPKVYRLKKDTNKRKHFGLLAHEVQKILPNLIHTGTDNDKLLAVDYTELIPVLIVAIQELYARLDY